MSFNIVQIRSESGLRKLLDEIKKNEYSKFEKEYNICIDFIHFNTKN